MTYSTDSIEYIYLNYTYVFDAFILLKRLKKIYYILIVLGAPSTIILL